jgi:hypothetical protein
MLVVEAEVRSEWGKVSRRCLWPARFTVYRNLISGLSAAAFEHALSTSVTLTQLTVFLLSNHLTPREPFTDMDHLIGCASSSVQLLALFANPPTANASTSYLRAKFGKLAGGPS